MTTDAKVSWKAKEAAIRALEKNGRVDPAELIEVARDPEHPCHSSFTWDIEQAAQERWRDQAREFLLSVLIAMRMMWSRILTLRKSRSAST